MLEEKEKPIILTDGQANCIVDFIEKKATWEEMTDVDFHATGIDSDEMVVTEIYRIYAKLSNATGRTNTRIYSKSWEKKWKKDEKEE